MSYPTYPQTYKTNIKVGDKTLAIEIGKFSEQVSASVLVTCGETVVHTTVALGRKVNLGYFPLSVEFVEKLYSAGTIKGSRWVKRDGRPTDDVILKARVIDRTMRPLFPSGITNEVQIVNTVFSYDGENDPDMLGMIGSALGLSISDIPFEGPVAGMRIGYSKETGKFLTNPTNTELETSDLDLIVSGSADTIVMVEAGANEISEAIMLEALTLAQKNLGPVCDAITKIVAEVGRDKAELISPEEQAEMAAVDELSAELSKKYAQEFHDIVKSQASLEQSGGAELSEKIAQELNDGKAEEDMIPEKRIKAAVEKSTKKAARSMILDKGERPDGRKTDEIRPIWCEVDVFPRTHGSAMFKRGATQAATITTLGSPALAQLVEGIEGQETRHYMHHYNSPPYSFGQAGRMGYPGRREIGHGALAERALLPMIPSQTEFPYTILVVSEIMSSNGSTSQASVCGSTMSLMAAGVPIKRPVAGIAMGLMSDGSTYKVLSDIQGIEDHTGDMDFKVAGTQEGITAIQMDIKLTGLTKKILEEALEQARVGRMHIMGKMMEVIDAPRDQISPYAPKIRQLTIPADKIGEFIGPGGKNIKALIESTGTEIDVEEDEEKGVGLVNISSTDQDKIDHAYTTIFNMMRTVDVGESFEGTVTRVEAYGAFVEYLPGREGLVHVSNMSTEYVRDAGDIVKLDDKVQVRVTGFKEDGKIELSMLTPEQEVEAREKRQNDRSNGSGDRGGYRGGYRGGNDRGRGGRGGDRGRGGQGGSRGRGNR